MTDYVLGQVAAVLGKPKSSQQDSKLAALFTVKGKPNEIKTENTKKYEKENEKKSDTIKQKKSGKRRQEAKEENEVKSKKKKREAQEKVAKERNPIKRLAHETETPETIVHWSKLSGAARRVASKESRKHNTDKDHRTIFIGNLPIKLAEKTKLKKLFSKYGAIESVRFRCPPTKDLNTSKRVAVIKKEYHPERDNLIAYVCFKDEFSAEKALFMNGKEVDGHHLRVDISTSNQKVNHNRSVFIGNLPFGIKEDDVRTVFEVCGEVENVRIVRDNKTGLGKGFCYVAFKKKDCVELALKLDGTELNKRELRVKRCVRDQPKRDKRDSEKSEKSSQLSRPKKKYNQPSNSGRHSFQGMKAKKSLKDKMKKKKIPRMKSSNMNSKQRHQKKDSRNLKSSNPKQFRNIGIDTGNKKHKRFD